jgi:hypothetical protein
MIFALTGAKGSGKDTVASLLKEMYPEKDIATVAFADPIKNALLKIFDLDSVEEYDELKRDYLHWGDRYDNIVSGRHVCREIGMLMRSYSDVQFVNYVKKAADSHNGLLVVTDLRFDNEYLALRDMGAAIIKIKNGRVHEEDMHITERGFDDELVDYVIENHDSMDDLKHNINDMMEALSACRSGRTCK